MEICDKYKVLDVNMMGALGIRALRCIEYWNYLFLFIYFMV